MQIMSLTHATPGTRRRCTRRRVMSAPRHANQNAVTDIADEVLAKVASHTRGALVLQLPTTAEDSQSEEEVTTPAPSKRSLKSGKIHTPDTTVLVDS